MSRIARALPSILVLCGMSSVAFFNAHALTKACTSGCYVNQFAAELVCGHINYYRIQACSPIGAWRGYACPPCATYLINCGKGESIEVFTEGTPTCPTDPFLPSQKASGISPFYCTTITLPIESCSNCKPL
jgi:hypothetical protein